MKTEPENGIKLSVNQNSYANNLAINIRKMLSHTKFIYLFSFTKYITWSDFILDWKVTWNSLFYTVSDITEYDTKAEQKLVVYCRV